jgi:ABC-type uncharacterized transport system ATPase subunit
LLEEPDGAGKTTTIEVIEGYKTPDIGGETALGLAPIRTATNSRSASASHSRRSRCICTSG